MFRTVPSQSSYSNLSATQDVCAIVALYSSCGCLATTISAISAAFTSLLAHEAAAKCSHAGLKTPPVIIRLTRRRCLLIDDLGRRLLLVLHLLRGVTATLVSIVHAMAMRCGGKVKWNRRTKLAAVAVGNSRPVVDLRSRLDDDVPVAAGSRLAGSIGSLTF